MKKREEKIKKYFKQKKDIYTALLDFIESTDDIETEFYYLTKYLNDDKIMKNREELLHFLQLLINIFNDHHRDPTFFIKIERILKTISDSIKQTLSKEELFNILISNRRIRHCGCIQFIQIIQK